MITTRPTQSKKTHDELWCTMKLMHNKIYHSLLICISWIKDVSPWNDRQLCLRKCLWGVNTLGPSRLLRTIYPRIVQIKGLRSSKFWGATPFDNISRDLWHTRHKKKKKMGWEGEQWKYVCVCIAGRDQNEIKQTMGHGRRPVCSLVRLNTEGLNVTCETSLNIHS